MLPTNIIENYKSLVEITKKINWPKKPNVFTSYGYHSDDIFQMWLAERAERFKVLLGQHSGNHHTSKNVLIEPGFENCDKFLSWGKVQNEKCIPFFNTRDIQIKKKFNQKGTKIYFYAPRMYPQRKRPYDDYGEMIRNNICLQKILKGLKKDLQSNIIIKPYQTEYQNKKFENKIISEIVFKDKRYKFDKPNISKQSIYEKSKIIVHLSDGTGVLETLSANIRVFIMPNLNYINIEARKDYQSLVKANSFL